MHDKWPFGPLVLYTHLLHAIVIIVVCCRFAEMVDTGWHFLDSVKKAAFVVGTSLIVFIAVRNSLIWQVESFVESVI